MARLRVAAVFVSAIASYFAAPPSIAQNCPNTTPAGYCVIGVPSVHDLRSGNWSLYQYAQTLGYYSAGDTGGNTIYRLDATSGDPDNGGSVIVDSAGDHFVATAPSTLNVMQWGATGSSRTVNISVSGFPIGSNMLTVTGAADFQEGQRIAVEGAGSAATVPTHPAIGTVVTVGNVANFTATSSGTSLTVSNVTGTTGSFTGGGVANSDHEIAVTGLTGTIAPGALLSGTGIPTPTYIQYQTSGRSGNTGHYLTTNAVSPSGTISFTNPGMVRIGETLSGSACVGSGVTITDGPTGGGAGTYTTSTTTTCSNASVTATDQANTYCVQLVALDSNQGYSAAGPLTCGALYGKLTRPDVSVLPEYIVVPWSPVAGPGTTAVAVYAGPQTTPTQQPLNCKFVQDVNFANFRNDYGQTSECPSWLPPSPPTSAKADVLRTTITHISGTTFTLTDTNVSGAILSSGKVWHDDTVPLQNALKIQTVVTAPCGTFRIFAPLLMTATDGQSLTGGGQQCTTLAMAGAYDGVTLETPGAQFTATASGTTLTVSATGFTGRIAVGGASFTGSQSGNTLTVNSAGFAGYINIGALVAGDKLPDGEGILAQLTGTTGGPGTYQVSRTLLSPVTGEPVTTGNGVNSGDTLSGVGVPPGTVVAQQLTGDPGADGTYLTNNPTTVSGTAVMTTGANVSSATFTGTLTTAHVLTVTSIVGSINIGDTVTAPLTSCGIASFNITGQSAGSPGSNGTYSTSASTGACSGISMSNKGTGISPFLSMYLQYLTIDGSDLASNFCLVLNNSNRAVVQNIVLNQCYDEVELTNSYVGTATNVWSNTRRRGDYGWWLWGAGTGGGSQAAIFDLTQVNLAASYQGISWYEDGNVATIRARHLGIQEAPVLFVSDNAVNSSQTPTYNEIYDLGLNVCWYTCMNL